MINDNNSFTGSTDFKSEYPSESSLNNNRDSLEEHEEFLYKSQQELEKIEKRFGFKSSEYVPLSCEKLTIKEVEEDIEIESLPQVNIASPKFKVKNFSIYSWTIMWVAIGFTIIGGVSALLTFIFYKLDLRPKEVGWAGFAPIIVVSAAWAIMNAIGYWFLDEDNHGFGTAKYIFTVIEFTILVWWLSFIFLFPDRGTPIDPKRIYSFVIPTCVVPLYLWVLWALIAFVPKLSDIGAWSLIGISTAVVILPAAATCYGISPIQDDGHFASWEFLIYWCILIGVLFILFFIFAFVIYCKSDSNSILAGAFYGDLILASYLIALVIVILAVLLIVKWTIKAVKNR